MTTEIGKRLVLYLSLFFIFINNWDTVWKTKHETEEETIMLVVVMMNLKSFSKCILVHPVIGRAAPCKFCMLKCFTVKEMHFF